MSQTPADNSTAKPPAKPKPKKRFLKQANMKRMIYALSPLAIAAVYFFGWRVVGVLGAVFVAGIITEWIMASRRGSPITTAGLVTCAIYGLSLPPGVPMWIAAVGAVVATLFGREVFGGFGKNPFNPAIVGRAFVYMCFPKPLTGQFIPAFEGFPGGFAKWAFDGPADAISQASPMWAYRELGVETPWWKLALGNISGTFEADGGERFLAAGSMGEGCAVLIVLAGAYLLYTKTANWRLMLFGLLGAVVSNVLFRNALGFDGLGGVPPLYATLLSGTTLFAVVFMITEPVSAPKKKPAQIVYAFLIGFFVVLLRWRGIFVAAATFSILLGNLLSPWLDLAATEWATRRKAKAAAVSEATS